MKMKGPALSTDMMQVMAENKHLFEYLNFLADSMNANFDRLYGLSVNPACLGCCTSAAGIATDASCCLKHPAEGDASNIAAASPAMDCRAISSSTFRSTTAFDSYPDMFSATICTIQPLPTPSAKLSISL